MLITTVKGRPETMLLFWFIIFVFGTVCGSLEPQPGDAERRELLHCNNRIDRIERYLRQQGDKLSDQENLIRELNAKLSHQENLCRQQEDNNRNLFSEFIKLQLQLRGQEQYRHHENVNVGRFPKAGAPTFQDVATRSDDLGPIEAVVTQLSQKVTELQGVQTQSSADIQTLKASNSQQDLNIQDARTSTFVQWGSSTCASSSTLIYSGVVGGAYYNNSGSAANYLCLTLSPVLLTKSGDGDLLYGGEYQTFDSYANLDSVCAVCRSAYATTVMIPGTNVCTPGWHKQYSGYLMAGGANDVAASEFVCVDSKLESVLGSNDDHNGKSLFYVRTRCGSLLCLPYANDKVVTCAVCSK